MRVTTIHGTVALWVVVSSWSFAARSGGASSWRRVPHQSGSIRVAGRAVRRHRRACCSAGREENPRHCGVGRRGRESTTHSCRTRCVRSVVVARRAATGRHCRRGPVGVSRQFVRRALCASNRGCRSARSSSTIARFRARAGRLTACCSGWSSPTAVRRGWKYSRPTAAGSSTPLRPSTTPSAGRPRVSSSSATSKFTCLNDDIQYGSPRVPRLGARGCCADHDRGARRSMRGRKPPIARARCLGTR